MQKVKLWILEESGQKAKGYQWLIYAECMNWPQEKNLIVLNRGVPVAERKACFGGQSALELTEEEGRQLAKRICLGDLSQQGTDGPMDVGVPDFPHPGVPDVAMQDPTDD